MKRILVPTDFSDASRAAIAPALELADAVGAELLLLHVVDEQSVCNASLSGIREMFTMAVDPTGHTFCYESLRDANADDLCQEAESRLAALLPPFFDDRIRTVVAVGHAAEEIVRMAREERVTLIVMGIHGKQGWRHLLLESVAERVVQQSPVPVLTLWFPRQGRAARPAVGGLAGSENSW